MSASNAIPRDRVCVNRPRYLCHELPVIWQVPDATETGTAAGAEFELTAMQTKAKNFVSATYPHTDRAGAVFAVPGDYHPHDD